MAVYYVQFLKMQSLLNYSSFPAMTICAGRLPFVAQGHPPPGSPPHRATCMDPAVSRVPSDVTLDSRVLLAPGGCGRWEGSRFRALVLGTPPCRGSAAQLCPSVQGGLWQPSALGCFPWLCYPVTPSHFLLPGPAQRLVVFRTLPSK